MHQISRIRTNPYAMLGCLTCVLIAIACLSVEVRADVVKHDGLDLLNVSVGFSTMQAQGPWSSGFMAPIAARVRREADIAVSTAWGMDDPAEAKHAIDTHQLELAMMGRAHLADPHYPFGAARTLDVRKSSSVLPEQYAYWLARYPGPQNGDPVD